MHDSDPNTDAGALALLEIAMNGESTEARREGLLALGPVLETYDTDAGWDEMPDELVESHLSELVVDQIQRMLRAMLQDEENPEHLRRTALEVAVRAPRKWHMPAVRAAIERGGGFRVTGAFCLGYLPGQQDRIRALAKDDDPEVVAEALRAAAAWADMDDIGRIAVFHARHAEDRHLRLMAIAALGSLGDDRHHGMDLLYTLSGDADNEVASVAAEALSDRMLMAELPDFE